MNLGELFEGFTGWAFRLERMPEYRVAEETSALTLFAQSGALPVGFNEEWADLVRSASESGRVMKRLRLISDGQLTPYERFELDAAYGPGLAAGEEIRVGRRSTHRDSGDFWLFDGEWKASMNYTRAGEFLGATVTRVGSNDPDVAYWLNAYERADQVLSPRLE
jgi:hypothetical protein